MNAAAPIVVIAGPTCTGKTRLAVEVALRAGAAELVNADSRQVRAGLHVGTCAPEPADLRGVGAHLFGVVEPGTPFTAGDWLARARRVIEDIRDSGAMPVLVGGTGLYLRALLRGYSLAPAPDPESRRRRNALAQTANGRQTLADELQRRDPARWGELDPRNTRRVIRALEALDAGSVPGTDPAAVPEPVLAVCLDTDRTAHSQWVRERSRSMLCSGRLQVETRAALQRGIARQDLAACGIGYAEAIAVLDGGLSVSDAVDAVTRRTLRYARQQRTFFRGEGIYRWLEAATPTAELADQVLHLAAGKR